MNEAQQRRRFVSGPRRKRRAEYRGILRPVNHKAGNARYIRRQLSGPGTAARESATMSAMKSQTEYLKFNVPARMGFVNITPDVEEIVRRSGVQEGLVLVNAMHNALLRSCTRLSGQL